MAKEYYHLFVIMCEDTNDHGMVPGVCSVFESRWKADDYVAKMNAEYPQMRYYIDTSFHNVFED
jgi:hypothetical protein